MMRAKKPRRQLSADITTSQKHEMRKCFFRTSCANASSRKSVNRTKNPLGEKLGGERTIGRKKRETNEDVRM